MIWYLIMIIGAILTVTWLISQGGIAKTDIATLAPKEQTLVEIKKVEAEEIIAERVQPIIEKPHAFMRCGDVNNDGIVNILDLASISLKVGIKENTAGYERRFDINKDGIIDHKDLQIINDNWSMELQDFLDYGNKCRVEPRRAPINTAIVS